VPVYVGVPDTLPTPGNDRLTVSVIVRGALYSVPESAQSAPVGVHDQPPDIVFKSTLDPKL
jgi:hypothetical protein